MTSRVPSSPRLAVTEASDSAQSLSADQSFSNTHKLLILSLCHCDIPFAIYYYCLYAELGYDVVIGTDDSERYRSLQKLFSAHSQAQSDHVPTILCHVNIRSLVSSYRNILIFTLGTYEICNALYKALANNSHILYIDCYFKRLDRFYTYRLVDPVKALISSVIKPQLSSRIQLIKQILKQILYDPLRTNYYFSADSHCWFTPRSLTLLQTRKHGYIDYSLFKKTHLSPPKSIIFVFGVYDNLPASIDWSFWSASGYHLYYKPHPNPSMSYQSYPSFVQPLFDKVSPLEIEFATDSFMVGFYSSSLGYTQQSISLLLLHRAPPPPLRLAYASNAGHLPTSKSELQSLLSPANEDL